MLLSQVVWVFVLLNVSVLARAAACDEALIPPVNEQLPQLPREFCEHSLVANDYNKLTLTAKHGHSAKIVDTFIFNGEFDMLNVRLMTMWPAVDYFVLVESNVTFTAKPKPLFFAEQQHRYKNFAQKLRHFVFPMPQLGDTWGREIAMRNAQLDRTQALQGIPLSEGDIVIVSDIDEVLDPTVLQYMRYCNGFSQDRICFRLRFSYYSYEFQKKKSWPSPQAIVVRNVSTFPGVSAQTLRATRGGCIKDSGWHCSYCFRDVAQFVNKLKSFSHTELAKDKYMNEASIINNVVHGKDLFFRGAVEDQDRVSVNATNVPLFVLENKDCYRHMINRTEWAMHLAGKNS